jgi:hypothetical protein
MSPLLRKAAFALPFGCVTAIATHFVRFGDDHVFGGDANEALSTAALGGSIAIALAILHVFLTSGSTTVTGTIARARVRTLVPNAFVIFGVAASVYYGIESLEGNGIELGLPTVVLALFAALVAFLLTRLCALLARFVAASVRVFFQLLDAQARIAWRLAPIARPLHPQLALVTRRTGRAPPNGRRFS